MSAVIVGCVPIIIGAFIATQNTQSKIRAPLVVIGIVLLIKPAFGHDNPEDWIGQEKRTNAAGVVCCGRGDCKSFTVDQVKVMPDGYHFPDGEIVAFGKAAPSIDHFYWKCVWGNETKCVFAPLGAS